MINSSESILVSIVIPSYNGLPYLKEAIDSVLNQTYSNIELIVLDDGSTDDTKHLLEKYNGRFYCESHKNMGQSATLNKGWNISKGSIIGYLSSDDVLYPDSVKSAVEQFQKTPETILTYSNTELIDSQSKSIRKIQNHPNWDFYGLAMNKYFINAVGSFFLKKAFLDIGGWNKYYKFIPDYEYYLRLAKLGKFSHIPYTLAKTRIHPRSISCSAVQFNAAEENRVLAEKIILDTQDKVVLKNKNIILSQGYLFSGRAHWKSHRFKLGARYFIKAILLNPLSLIQYKTYKLVLNALFK